MSLLPKSLMPNLFKRAPSMQMRAVLHIASADPVLEAMLMPHFDLKNEAIDWTPIFKLALCKNHRSAVLIAFCVWTDRARSKTNPFELAMEMEQTLKRACLEALAIRWGLLS